MLEQSVVSTFTWFKGVVYGLRISTPDDSADMLEQSVVSTFTWFKGVVYGLRTPTPATEDQCHSRHNSVIGVREFTCCQSLLTLSVSHLCFMSRC